MPAMNKQHRAAGRPRNTPYRRLCVGWGDTSSELRDSHNSQIRAASLIAGNAHLVRLGAAMPSAGLAAVIGVGGLSPDLTSQPAERRRSRLEMSSAVVQIEPTATSKLPPPGSPSGLICSATVFDLASMR
jgi:hypothetical protein